jgi:hypothetical protein
MADPLVLGPFLAASLVVSVLWGRALWYFDERSDALRRWVFLAMSFTRRRPGEVRASLLSAIYYGLGLLASLAFAAAFGLDARTLLAVSPAHLAPAVLGVVAEVSLANLLVDLGRGLTGWTEPSRFAEMRDVPWMRGLRELPAAAVPAVAALGGVVEEIFFRGVLLVTMTERLRTPPAVAVAVAGGLFCLEQLVQVRTAFQALVIGAGCAAISLGGGLLVVHTGSVVPAAVCHASFVVFFVARRARG